MLRVVKRFFVVLPALLAEGFLIYLLMTWLRPWAAWIEGGLRVIGFLLMLFVISYRQEGTYKILWVLFFSAFPAAAALTYLLFGNKRTARPLVRRMAAATKRLGLATEAFESATSLVRAEDERIADTLDYVTTLSGFPAIVNESATYYPLGEEGWAVMLEELRRAEHYIYLEYFIVEDGIMLGEMLKIMAEKARSGVDVRFMYDDFGSLTTFDGKDQKKLDADGIKWMAFNPLRFLTGTLNNRSHRKMLIIDGRVAFSGGVNLADEYINKVVKFGHWKDDVIKITGPAVGAYLFMFTEFWNAFSADQIPSSAFDLVPHDLTASDGVVLSYYDSPFNRDPVSENLYIEMLGNVKDYAWFYSPYLMLGETLMDAFVRAAQRGIDVRVIVPGVPDKALVYRLTRSYFQPLIEAGVKIYTYTPGFVHTKATLFDDDFCTIGTVNLDYRSLYLHFENNSAFWHSAIAGQLKADMEATFAQCKLVSEEDISAGFFSNVLDGILRIFAPLC